MSKRFTATEKWDKPWYRRLPPRLKCLWQFLCDRCDQAGVIEIDWELASFQIGEDVKPSDLTAFEEQVHEMAGAKLWLKAFVEFQYGKLSETCPAHKPVLRSIKKHFGDTLLIPYQYPIDRVQEEEEEEEEEDEEEGDKEKESRKKAAAPDWSPTPEQLTVGQFFKRRASTPWQAKEVKAWNAIPADSRADGIAILSPPYLASEKYCRRDLITLLNNWQGEIDRWRSYKPAIRSDVTPAQANYDDPAFLTNDDAIFHKA